MPYTINVNVTQPIVTATESVSNITITETGQTFTITNQVSNFSVTNIVQQIDFNADGGVGFDFISKNIGDWVSGTTYYRNDIVRYQYSIYIANTGSTQSFVSTIEPPNDTARWEEFWTTDWTFPKLRTSALRVGPMNYAATTSTPGYVLAALDSTTSYWTSLGSLVIWDLSDDLRTNGFNIVTGSSINDPNPQLTIGSGAKNLGNNPSSLKSYIKLHQVPLSSSLGGISIKGLTTFTNNTIFIGDLDSQGSTTVRTFTAKASAIFNNDADNAATFNVYTPAYFNSDVNINSISRIVLDNNASIKGDTLPVRVNPGIRFPDGSSLTSAYGLIGTGTGTLRLLAGTGISLTTSTTSTTINLQTATFSSIGGVRIDSNSLTSQFTVTQSTGILGLNTASTVRVGGVKIGNGVDISADGTISVNTGGGITNIDSGNAGIAVVDGITTTITLMPASTSTIGGIIVGNGLLQSGSPQTLNLKPATSSAIGGVIIGSGISVAGDGTISINTGTLVANSVNLLSDMITNGYLIKYANTTTNSELLIGNQQASIVVDTDTNRGLFIDTDRGRLQHNANNYFITSSSYAIIRGYNNTIELYDNAIDIKRGANSIKLNANAEIIATNINLRSTTSTVVGYDIYSSELQVSKIFNFSGTGPPFFPEGVQYPDNTVQVTAFRSNQGIIP